MFESWTTDSTTQQTSVSLRLQRLSSKQAHYSSPKRHFQTIRSYLVASAVNGTILVSTHCPGQSSGGGKQVVRDATSILASAGQVAIQDVVSTRRYCCGRVSLLCETDCWLAVPACAGVAAGCECHISSRLLTLGETLDYGDM